MVCCSKFANHRRPGAPRRPHSVLGSPERNKATRSELKSRTKTAVRTIGDESNDEAVRMAVKKIDSAASKGIIHKNTAARKKSRLMKKVNAAA